MNRLQFGLAVAPGAGPGADPVGFARRAEELGFDFLSTSDHPCGTEPTFEVWTLLTWLAATTSRIRFATRVLGVPYRSPALVAKMAESLDRLSGGRFILGLGGGSADHEFRAFGLGMPSPRDKVDGMREAVEIVRGLWSTAGFTYRGRIYRTDAADIAPRPAHRIPIWLGTYGNRALAVTGRLADGWIPSYGYAPPDVVGELRARVIAAAREAGRNPDEITSVYHVPVRVGGGLRPSPGEVAGTAAEVADHLLGLVKLGFDALSLVPSGPDLGEQVEILAREVVPAVHASSS